MSEEIEAYQSAIAKLQAAKQRAEEIKAIVVRASIALQDWRKASVSGLEGGYPAEVIMLEGRQPIMASNWPTAGDIHKALTGYHEAKLTCKNAYQRVPDTQKPIVQGPDQFF